ncbi:type IV secretion system protein [Dyella nitratireducens]|uniref:Type IV secretion system protein VirB6 n=1 Tax=Dyella nitratireducens TaxID=1849580 RepID=A0ABQ1FN81_9GAMM|nr:type IV secretion system protein [Dyella nitratireducens]GGA22139.1 hypothetical protein GCM10010981_07910 [Dyella nitratireducens]GLQ44149.1 hypothetical protein GCM10007902_39990 [Dyella nitratireducens]
MLNTDFVFFVIIYNWLDKEIGIFTDHLFGNAMQWVAAMAYVLVTLWIMFTGYRALTGTLHEPLMATVVRMAKVVVIMSAATSMSFFGSSLSDFVTKDLNHSINQLVTGDDASINASIDRNLAITEVAMTAIDAVQLGTGDAADQSAASDKSMSKYLAMFGTAGPPLTAATMLLMYRFAIALFIGLGPIFILCLMFDQTKTLFQRWLMYGISTLFSMAVLNVVVAMVMKLSLAIAGAVWTGKLLSKFLFDQQQGITHVSLEQGGIGLILTMLIITVPPMAANFFQGTLGNFMHYSGFGNGNEKWKKVNVIKNNTNLS